MTTGWRLPDAPLRTSVLGANAAGLLAVVAASTAARAAFDLGPLYPLTSALVFAGIATLTTGFVQSSHRYPRFGPANILTTARAALVALIAGLIGDTAAPAMATAAAVTSAGVTLLDGVDGWLARRTRLSSAFGARFDMETDALLIMALSILAWQLGKAGVWVLLAGLMRYLFVAAGWIDARFERPLFPSQRRRVVCVVQILGLSAVVLPAIEPPVSIWLSGALVVMLAYSFAVDTIWLWRRRE